MEEIIEKIMKSTNHYVEAYVRKTDKINTFFDSKLREVSSGSVTSLTVRVKVGNTTGAAFTTDLNRWKEALNNAISIAKSSPEHEIGFELPGKQTYYPVKIFSKKVYDMSEQDIIERGVSALNNCSGVTVQQLVVEKTINDEIFANSNGIHTLSKDTLLSSEIAVTKSNATAWEGCMARSIPDFENMADSAVDICKKSINPIKIKTQKIDLILGFHAINDLFESILVPALSADYVVEGRSRFAGKIGEQVASEKFTLYDDGSIDMAPGSYKFDSEGVSKRRTVLIDKGILKNFMSDWYSGQKLTRKLGRPFTGSTGNCESLLRRPSVAHSNFVIPAGKSELYEGSALMVHHLVGLHTSNKISGDFSLNCENAFLVNNGRIVPVKNVMISGNIFDMLKKVSGLGKVQITDGNVITPQIRFSDMQIIA